MFVKSPSLSLNYSVEWAFNFGFMMAILSTFSDFYIDGSALRTGGESSPSL